MLALLIGLFIGVCAAGELENLYLPPPGGYKLQEPNAYNGDSLTSKEYAVPESTIKNEEYDIDYFKQPTAQNNNGVRPTTKPVNKFVSNDYHRNTVNLFMDSSSNNYPQTNGVQYEADFKYSNEPNSGDGAYNFEYETKNGIKQTEYGYLANDDEEVVEGSYSYTGPDGVVYTVNYRADATGFHATGAHLPTSPPIPDAILKSIRLNAEAEENRRHDDDMESSGFNAGYKY